MPSEVPRKLLIVGASVRAAAQAAVRAGYEVWGADLFADADLCDISTARTIARYPSGLLAELAAAPEAPWMYTGALENYPALLSRMAKLRTCWGNSVEVIRRVRDPLLLFKTLPPLGVAFPATFKTKETTNTDGARWLLKPKRSGGGSKVTWLDESHTKFATGRAFLQQYIPGEAYSAVYVAAGGQAALLGMTRQLLGIDWLGAKGFSYCGSVGSIRTNENEANELRKIGNVLAEKFGLVGLFGVDLVQRAGGEGQGEFVVIEVNPRYTASIEVLERSMNFLAVTLHADACESGLLPATSDLAHSPPESYLAKGILFARQDATFHVEAARYVRARNVDSLLPAIADVPHVATPIAAGSPVVTLLASGSSPVEAEAALRRAVREFEGVLYKA